MIWGILSTALAMFLTILLAIYSSTKKIKILAVGVAILIVFIQSYMMYEENVTLKYQLNAIEKIGTIIDWDKSEVKINYLNTKEELDKSDVRVELKFYSVVKSVFPKNSEVNLEQLKKDIEFSEKNDLGILTEVDAAKIFFAYEKSNGSIYWDEENKGKIQRALYYKDSIKEIHPGTSIMVLEPEWLPDVQSPYLSLLDLNDGFVIVRIQTTGVEKSRPYAIQIKLKSSMGNKNLYTMLRQVDPKNKTDLTSSVRYVGIYIPKEYFKIIGG